MKPNSATQTGRSPFGAQVAFARATTALGGMGFGALAVGATAVGAVAIGALAIRKLAIKRGRIERLDIGEQEVGRLPNAAHESRPWRIREIAPDFTLEDVWALPANGGAEDFQTLLELMTSGLTDPADWESLPTRVLCRVRDRLGSWFGLGRISVPVEGGRDDLAGKLPIPGTDETSLADRLPDDLRNTAADVHFDSVPFVPLYRTDIEFAEEMSNRTVHAVGHLAWAIRAKAATKDRWPSTSSHAVCSGRDTWRSSSRSGIGSFTQHSCERSNERGIHAFPRAGRVLRSAPDFALLAASSRLRVRTELLVERQQQALFAVFVHQENVSSHGWGGRESRRCIDGWYGTSWSRPAVRTRAGPGRRTHPRRRPPASPEADGFLH